MSTNYCQNEFIHNILILRFGIHEIELQFLKSKHWFIIRLFIGGQVQTRNTYYTSKNVTEPKNDYCDCYCDCDSNVYNIKVTVNSISGRS